MRRRQYSRLCCLVHNSLYPFTVISSASMTKGQEKSLLINLSQVLNKIKLWIGELDSGSDSDDGGDHSKPLIDYSATTERTTHCSMCHSSVPECIFKIINDLVFFIAVESCYARHVAGNVIVAVSEFVVASGSYWEQFVQSLCYYFEQIFHKVVSPSLDSPRRPKHLDGDQSFKLDLQSVSSDVRWFSVGAFILVLRNILKHQKHDDHVEILEVYLNVLGSTFQNIPWDLCNEILINDDVKQPLSWFEFCGYLVQLFCSVVSHSTLTEAVDDSVEKHPAIQEIFKAFPKILTWCLGKQRDNYTNTCITEYIQHKILVLMTRLSSLIDLDCEMLVSWMHLIDKYFKDLLYESVTQPEGDEDDCLKDSPFLPILHDVECIVTSHRHLQRRVVFLYLRCAFSLINVKDRRKAECLCGDVKSCSNKGFTALYEWLEKHLPVHNMNSELYYDTCKNFTKSFLQLYMHEDDMLFEVLLQLTYMPFGCTLQIAEKQTFQVAEKDTLFLLADIFDPVRLFHLFLLELHYDHQVLLDCLISKDTGASCAEYLLRCLRIICDKWNSFLGFQSCIEVGSDSSYKRRKVTNDSCIQQALSSQSASDKIPLSSKIDHLNQKICKQLFYDARDCLLLLKKSVESLHQKDLFPYNPQVLLRRLSRFQELCQRS